MMSTSLPGETMVLRALKKSKCQLIRFFAMALYNFELLGTIQGVRKIVRVRMALRNRATS